MPQSHGTPFVAAVAVDNSQLIVVRIRDKREVGKWNELPTSYKVR